MAANVCRPRSLESIAEVVSIIDPERNVELLRHDVDGDGKDETFCNYFLHEATVLLECSIPKVRANDQIQWLRDPEGAKHTWRKVTPAGAIELALRGAPVVVGWWNPNPRFGPGGEPLKDASGKPLHRPGHVALVRAPPPPSLEEPHPSGVWIAQAGKRNFNHAKLIQGFGQLAPLEFFAHD